MAVYANTPIELINSVYASLDERLARGRERLGRALTLTEKILINHLDDVDTGGMERGVSYTDLRPDRVAMQDATAQMAWLQFMTAGLDETAVPTTTHCDHLIQARVDGKTRPRRSRGYQRRGLRLPARRERQVRRRLLGARIGHHPPGRARELRLPRRHDARHRQPHAQRWRSGNDRRRCRRGRRSRRHDRLLVERAVAQGNRRTPHRLTHGWAAPKDVILKVAEILTVKGGTGAIVEYFGPGAESISATGKATICNMGAEIGATTSLFAYDDATSRYLKATGREEIDDAARRCCAPPARR